MSVTMGLGYLDPLETFLLLFDCISELLNIYKSYALSEINIETFKFIVLVCFCNILGSCCRFEWKGHLAQANQNVKMSVAADSVITVYWVYFCYNLAWV